MPVTRRSHVALSGESFVMDFMIALRALIAVGEQPVHRPIMRSPTRRSLSWRKPAERRPRKCSTCR